MEQREITAANLRTEALSDAQQEINQLRTTASTLRDQLDRLRKEYEEKN